MFYVAVSISDLNRPYDENSTSLAIKDRKKKAKADRDRQTLMKFFKDIKLNMFLDKTSMEFFNNSAPFYLWALFDEGINHA